MPRKKLVYELTLVDDWHGDGKTIVYHMKGDVDKFDSALPVSRCKKGNQFETPLEFIKWCEEKSKAFGIKLINNMTDFCNDCGATFTDHITPIEDAEHLYCPVCDFKIK